MGLFKKKEEVPELPKAPSLPDLPASNPPAAPVAPATDIPELPAFPSTPENNNLNQEIVKSAVSDSPNDSPLIAPEPNAPVMPQAEPVAQEIPAPGLVPNPIEPKQIMPPTGGPAASAIPAPEMPQFPEVPNSNYQPLTPMDAAIEENAQAPSFDSPIPEPPIEEEPGQFGYDSEESKSSLPEKTAPNNSADPIFVRIDKFQDAQKGFAEIKEKVKDIEAVLKKIKNVKSKEEEELVEWSEEIQKLKGRLSEIDADIFSQI